MAAPSTRLNVSLSDDLKADIISQFWRKPRTEIRLEDYTLYFQFYHKSCEALYLGLRSEAISLITESHEHLLAIVRLLWSYLDDGQPCKRLVLRRRLGDHFSDLLESSPDNERATRIDNSINLALRLWLTIEIREEIFTPATFAIQWDDNSTLQDFVRFQFPGPRMTSALTEKETLTILKSDFTAANLRRIGGIIVDWTYHLNEHLSYDRELRKLKVYTLKTCLYDQKAR